MSFVKIHGSILLSSIWSEPHATRVVWITMLALANENGVVEASVGGLARAAAVSRAECEEALRVFLSPDQDSRDGTTGERIEKVPGGWLVLNHLEYRERRTKVQIQTAERVRRHREAKKRVTRNDVTPDNGKSPSEAEAEAEAEKKNPPTPLRGKASFDPVKLLRDEFPELVHALPSWEEWVAERRDRKKPMTERAARKQLKAAAEYGPGRLKAAIDQSIANGWVGLFPDKASGPAQAKGPILGPQNPELLADLERQRQRKAEWQARNGGGA